MANDFNAIKHCIDTDMKNIEKNVENNSSNNDDILIKYFDMFEKGLITREEFELKKKELFNNKNNGETHLKSEYLQQDKPKFCPNCGTPTDNDSNFCTNCGNKLK